MSHHQLGEILALVLLAYMVLVVIGFNVWARRRRSRGLVPTTLHADPEGYLRYGLPLVIAMEAAGLIAAALVWPIELLETEVGNIPHFNLVMRLFLAGLAAFFIGYDALMVLLARREMRRQRSAMR